MQKSDHDISEKIDVLRKLNRSLIILLRGAATQQMSIAMFSHPFGAGQMTVERMSRAIWLPIRINMQHNPRYLAPIRALGVGVEEPQISHNMFLVVARQRRGGGRHVSNIGVERGLLNWHP
jgi:hypothetical protein